MKKSLFMAALATVLASPAAMAQDAMPAHDHAAMMKSMDDAAPADVYATAMETMHKDMMAVKATGDADVDFVNGMIPHHQGAVDMAKTLKEKGKDPELQKMADDIIVAQEKEIAFMKDWLARHEKK